MTPLLGLDSQGASPQPDLLLAGRSQHQQLNYRSLDIAVSISDQHGRQASITLRSEQLDVVGTYDRFGVVAGHQGGDGKALVERIRAFAGDQIAEQFRHLAGERGLQAHTVHERQETRLSAQRLSVSVSGDSELLASYLSAPDTAQRIFDFARGLGAHIEPDSDRFGDFTRHMRSGIERGFEMAEAILGPLPEISQETRELLRLMLEALESAPKEPVPTAATLFQQRLLERADQRV